MSTFDHRAFPAARIAAEREQTVSICLPARDEERTIGPILEQLVSLRELGAIDQIVVVDRSSDGTAQIARLVGVEVHDQEALAPELGPVLGKGDAMWRALHVLWGEVVRFLDADTEDFGAHFAARPLLNLFYPERAAIRQPLAGEVAARHELLERLLFVTGYGVDVALLLDAYRCAGLGALGLRAVA
ncbi:MAG: hypothetical protein M3065_14760 [Actinomycetota bacterium]|nr:hypothetical protein [Actinomycetota bacterium]